MKLSVILFFLLLPLKGLADFPLLDESSRKFEQGLWNFQSQLTYFQATANYTKTGGSYTELKSDAAYHLIHLDFGFHYGFSKKMGFYANSQIANAESQYGSETRTTSSLTQVVGGMDSLLYHNGATEVISDFSLTYPFKKVTAETDDVLNNEGATELSAQLIARQNWSSFLFFASGGFLYRDEGRAGLMPYSLGSEWSLQLIKLGAELRGYETVTNDQYTDNPRQRQSVASKNGGSLKFYSVNPSLLETHLWIRSNTQNQLDWKVGAGTTLTGASSAAGWNLFVGLSFDSDLLPKKSSVADPTPVKPKPKSEVDQFEEDVSDEANQKYFIKPAPKPVPPPLTPENQKLLNQKDFDQIEYQIKLKRKKQKKKPKPR